MFPFISFTQENNILKVEEPIINTQLEIDWKGSKYIEKDIYLVNKNYVVYQNATDRKIIYPNMNSFHFPEGDENNYFALDKNTVYFRGKKNKN